MLGGCYKVVKIILKKWRKPQALKNCRYLKVKDTKSGEEKMYGYKPKLEIAVLEKGSDGKPFYDILGFFDKDEKKIKVDIKELLKINYDTNLQSLEKVGCLEIMTICR